MHASTNCSVTSYLVLGVPCLIAAHLTYSCIVDAHTHTHTEARPITLCMALLIGSPINHCIPCDMCVCVCWTLTTSCVWLSVLVTLWLLTELCVAVMLMSHSAWTVHTVTGHTLDVRSEYSLYNIKRKGRTLCSVTVHSPSRLQGLRVPRDWWARDN